MSMAVLKRTWTTEDSVISACSSRPAQTACDDGCHVIDRDLNRPNRMTQLCLLRSGMS